MSCGRSTQWRELECQKQWDVIVVGGGATGLGTALEAASRGYRTLLVERNDFAKGTSSRSTKLVHGGVRYLEQMNIALVTDALRERGLMLRNAPHLVHKLGFVVPIYSLRNLPYYGLGLKAYEWMSGKLSFGRSEVLSRADTIQRLPTIVTQGLKGGVLYWDGQFDDARYAIALMRTIEDHGGFALNHAAVVRVLLRNRKVEGVRLRNEETGEECDALGRVVINATGIFTEDLVAMATNGRESVLSLSQGSHFVFSKDLIPGPQALMVPKTADGRVLFAIPWHDHVVVGTTDVAVKGFAEEPRALRGETEFLREHLHRYLGCRVKPEDVLSMWSGLRPLVKSSGASTAKLSRDHKVFLSPTRLVTVTGGKWTTYRRMGEDTIDQASSVAGLSSAPSRTKDLRLHGWMSPEDGGHLEEHERVYGSDAGALRALGDDVPGLNARLHARLPYRERELVWAVRKEKARTVEDLLARRTRALFLDARAAIEAAPRVSHLLAHELQWTEKRRARDLQNFLEIAEGYIYRG